MWARNNEVWYRKCYTIGDVNRAMDDCRYALRELNISRNRRGLPWFTLVREPKETGVVSPTGVYAVVTAKILIGDRESNNERARRFQRNFPTHNVPEVTLR